MAHRFFIPPEQWNPRAPELTGAEARHALDVLRLGPGDPMEVFDGEGRVLETSVVSVAKHRVVLAAGAGRETPQLPCALHLAQAIPKGKTMDLIVQKATELGVSAIHPLVTRRVIARPEPGETEHKREKWQRVAIEACKQCGQNHLPRVSAPTTLDAFLSARPENSGGRLMLIGSLLPGSRHLKSILGDWLRETGSNPAEVVLLIGPEGDFTPEEIGGVLQAGGRPMTMGPIILRAETAAIYGLSVLSHELLV